MNTTPRDRAYVLDQLTVHGHKAEVCFTWLVVTTPPGPRSD
jgi:hypothetical protein